MDGRGTWPHGYRIRQELEPGGTLLDARQAPYNDYELYEVTTNFGMAQSKKRGVEFKFDTEVTADMIADELPDAVVIATGAEYVKPEGWGR